MTLTDEQRAKVEALIGAKVMGLDVRGMHQCYQCEGCWDVDDDLAWTGSGHERVRPVYRVGEGWTPEPDERIIFGCPAHSLGVVPEYTTSGDAMLEVEERVSNLAVYNGQIVEHRTTDGCCSRQTGLCLKELYTLALLRITNPDMPEFEMTTMGENNHVRRTFRTDELWNLLHATPLQRCLASLSAVGVDWRAELGVKEEAE
jgi:hypothetical protein